MRCLHTQRRVRITIRRRASQSAYTRAHEVPEKLFEGVALARFGRALVICAAHRHTRVAAARRVLRNVGNKGRCCALRAEMRLGRAKRAPYKERRACETYTHADSKRKQWLHE